MEIKYLLQSQANQLFQAIKAGGLEPTDFEWQDMDGHYSGHPISALIHKPSGYFFTFDNVD